MVSIRILQSIGAPYAQDWITRFGFDADKHPPLHTALDKSKNMVSIRILQSIGAPYAQDWITRFGFDADKHPPYLTMALGAGSVTPMQMASAYSVFANGGYRLNPTLVTRITDQKGKVLAETTPQVLGEPLRVIDARNAFMMSRLLQ